MFEKLRGRRPTLIDFEQYHHSAVVIPLIEKDGKYLMLHRVKKENDLNKDKWIGVGGKLEKDESPENCLYREVFEETGLKIKQHQFRGVVTFISDVWDSEMMFLYTAETKDSILKECDEGELKWITEAEVPSLNLWEGDRIFIDLLCQKHPFFSLKLCYRGYTLICAELDGKELQL